MFNFFKKFRSCWFLNAVSGFVIIMFSLVLVQQKTFSQSYITHKPGTKIKGNYYSPAEKIEIFKMPKGQYSENSFYIKTHTFSDIYEIRKIIENYLGERGYPDLEIDKIERTFAKYFSNDLLRKSNSNLENVAKIKINNNFEIFDLCSLLNESGHFEYAIPEIFYNLSDFVPNDTAINQQWWLEAAQLFKAWDIAKGDKTITIGIIDSGVDFRHEDLINQVKINSEEIPDDGIDNDGNGFIDDVYGWDFVGDINHNDAVLDKFKEDNDVIPAFIANDHGTHVAGISSAQSNNGMGIASAGYNVKFLPVKIGVDDLTKSRMVYRPYEGVMYAVSLGADIINCSWSSEYHDPLAIDVLNEVTGRGVIVVAAAGNENAHFDFYPYLPASHKEVIAVGASNQSSRRAFFSNYGVDVTCYAPGEGIYSTLNNNRYGTKSGTSMATPLVSGIVSTMMNVFPNYTNRHIIKQLRATLSPLNPKTYFTHGIVNAFDAFRYNNASFPAYEVPGLGIEEIMIEGSDAIRNYGATKIILKIKNYLSNSTNIKIDLSPQDDYFTVSPLSNTIQRLNKNEEKELEFTINLRDNCPWFDGDAYIFVRFSADNYNEHELISIPVKIETNNRFLMVNNFRELVDIEWLASVSKGNFDFWCAGYDHTNKKGVLYNFGKLNRLSNPINEAIIDISAADDRNIMLAANGDNSQTKVLFSTNSGLTFKSTDLSPMLSYIAGVNYFSDATSIAYGENTQELGGVVYSTDGGVSFRNSSFDFTFSGSAKEYLISKINVRNDIAYLGSSAGRIIKSTNQGRSWQEHSRWFNEAVISIAAISDDTLFALIENNEQISLQVTKNGGRSFSVINYNYTDLGKTMSMFVPDESNTIYIVDISGKIYYSSDLGETWKPELNYMYKFRDLHTASLFSKSGKARLWLAGYDVNYLDFDVIPANISRDVKIAGRNEILFDTTNIFEFNEDIIFIENKGNIKEKISNQQLSIGEDFEIIEPFKNTLSPSELISAVIKYNPKSTGWHYDTITVHIEASAEPLQFILSGFSVDPVSVNDKKLKFEGYKLIKKSKDNYVIEFNSTFGIIKEIKLFDLSGKMIRNFAQRDNFNSIIEINTEDLSRGFYYLLVSSENYTRFIKIIAD